LLIRPLIVCAAILTFGASVAWADNDIEPTITGDSILLSNIHMWKGNQFLSEGKIQRATDSFLIPISLWPKYILGIQLWMLSWSSRQV
jgi:hypothetical protein